MERIKEQNGITTTHLAGVETQEMVQKEGVPRVGGGEGGEGGEEGNGALHMEGERMVMTAGEVAGVYRDMLARLAPTISRAHFVTWFKGTAALSVEGGVLTIGAPTLFARDWIQSKYAVKLLQAAQEQHADIRDVVVVVEAMLGQGDSRAVSEKELVVEEKQEKRAQQRAVSFAGVLAKNMTFKTFVPCDENRLAYAAALSVARQPAKAYNPLVIYGGVGLGKTHVLTAIGHEFLTCFPGKKLAYFSAEQFITEYVNLAKAFRGDEFVKRYREVDMLLLDDVQMLADKEKTQEAFFHVLNALHAAGKQIVVTSDRAPAELADIMDRLRSRLEWGLVCEVTAPHFASRLSIVRAKAMERRFVVDPAVLECIALNMEGSVRSLEGVLNRCIAESELLKRPVAVTRTLDIISQLYARKEVLGRMTREPRTAEQVLAAVARVCGMTKEEMLEATRMQSVVRARKVAMYLLRELLSLSFGEIGELFGKNHTTALHAVRSAEKEVSADGEMAQLVAASRAAVAG